MQTHFTPDQLNDPTLKAADDILRKCVHCGFCTATCPTYTLLGDELDGPRGRIYMIKDMLEGDKGATPKVAKHLDRCLSCLSCMTTCPASVNYMHLIDMARVHVEKTHVRPLPERMLRKLLAILLPNPGLFRLSLYGAKLARPFAGLLPGRLKGIVAAAPRVIPSPSKVDTPQTFKASSPKLKRVALMNGCAQKVLRPEINEATIRLLGRHGCEVIIAEGGGCCGALVHHMGQEHAGHQAAKANIIAWENAEKEGGELDAIVINASGCGTTVKDYGFMLRNDPDWAARATRISGLTRDITEIMSELTLRESVIKNSLVVAYHSACSLQHGQKVTAEPKALLEQAGFTVKEPVDSHLCCGSAGTYSLLQPELAGKLQKRKVDSLQATKAHIIAAGNIGCLEQISAGFSSHETPPVIVHTAELLDWATGGPTPKLLETKT